MKTEYVYHVVTERPMELGQKLIFDQQHHNGVYHRVTAFKALLCGEPVEEKLVRLLQADMDKWSKVAYREMALEKIRKEYFPTYPSRMACLYTSRTLQEAQSWAKFFQDIGRDVYSIVRLKAGGGFFDGDACNCFDGVPNEVENLEKAWHYWKKDCSNEKPVIETLIDGEITVEEIIISF